MYLNIQKYNIPKYNIDKKIFKAVFSVKNTIISIKISLFCLFVCFFTVYSFVRGYIKFSLIRKCISSFDSANNLTVKGVENWSPLFYDLFWIQREHNYLKLEVSLYWCKNLLSNLRFWRINLLLTLTKICISMY